MKTVFTDLIPDNIKAYFANRGTPLTDALLVLRLDMHKDGNLGDGVIALFKDRFIILESLTVFTSAGKDLSGRSVRNEDLRISRFETISLEEIENPIVEQLISTGRVVAQAEGESLLLFNFTSACKHSAGVFCRAVNDLKSKGELEEEVYGAEDYKKHCCPKCKRRYPDGELKVCPHCADTARLVKRLSVLFFRYKSSMLMIILSFALMAGLAVVTPYISNELLYDDVLGNINSTAADVLKIVMLIVAVRVLSLFINLLSGAISSTVAAKVTYDLKKMIFNTISDLSLGFFTNRQTGGLMTQVNSDSLTLYWFFCDGFPFLVMNVLQLLVIMAVMFAQNTLLALYTFITVPIFFVSFRSIHNMFSKLHAKGYSKSRSLNSLISDVLNGMRVVKTFSREDEEIKRFDRRSREAAETWNDIRVWDARVFPLLHYLLRIGSYVVWGVGGWQVMNSVGDMSYGRLMAFIGYFALIYGPIEQLADVTNWWSQTLNALQRLFEIRDAKPDVMESENPIIPKESRGEVEFKNVCFSYVENRKVIDDVSFSIPAGKTLGIVGQTGAGKSTLANLLTRLYDVKSGGIFIDGVNIKDLPFDYLRQNVAIVSQETYLFRGSILENIRYACPNATKEQVINAAKSASAHDFIIKLPDGYNTEIGFGKKELSGGEKQRVSIARALLRDPKILILDEATAAMDTQTERNIQAALDRLTKNRTTVIIAHRLSTLRNADNLVAIENGKVAESGTAQELLKQKGVYHKLYKLQAEALKNVGIGE
ncbi:MAG: ABC transporter ATP-binding protein [Ruminococcaceae bacterium]|nr:ABC transporter ATP-binding protein [Oscillospiraceae bacterium]